ncbi:MAG: hypothetical protein WA662_22450, partial [Pseudolabrys sp.]
ELHMPAKAKPSDSANNILTHSGVISGPQRITGRHLLQRRGAGASQSLTNGKCRSPAAANVAWHNPADSRQEPEN